MRMEVCCDPLLGEGQGKEKEEGKKKKKSLTALQTKNYKVN